MAGALFVLLVAATGCSSASEHNRSAPTKKACAYLSLADAQQFLGPSTVRMAFKAEPKYSCNYYQAQAVPVTDSRVMTEPFLGIQVRNATGRLNAIPLSGRSLTHVRISNIAGVPKHSQWWT